MKRHINECKGLDPSILPMLQGLATPPTASQESVQCGHSPKKSSQVSKHVGRKKKGHHSKKPQPAVSASQEDSQGVDRRGPMLPALAKKVQLIQQSTTLNGKRSQSCTRRISLASNPMHASRCTSAFHHFVTVLLNKLVSHPPVLVIINIVIVGIVCAMPGYRC